MKNNNYKYMNSSLTRKEWKSNAKKEKVLKELPGFLVTLFILYVIFIGVFFTVAGDRLDIGHLNIFNENKEKIQNGIQLEDDKSHYEEVIIERIVE